MRDSLRKIRKRLRDVLQIDAIKAAAIAKFQRRPVCILFNAVRRAPRGKRKSILRCALPSILLSIASSVSEPCEFGSLADFEKRYTQLAAMLGCEGKTPPPGETEFLASIERRRVYYPGQIGPPDHLFLTAWISILAPRRVLEIGTLTGFSAGVIASALARRYGQDGSTWVDTIDTRRECAIDATRPTGFEIPELFPGVAEMIRLHTLCDATFVAQLATRDELEVAFIDADHRHPMPLLDLLRLTPYMRPASWVLLHDTKLGTMVEQAIARGRKTAVEPVHGAEWLFDRWPYRKISGGNIGAVQLPRDKSALVRFALQMMSIRFETTSKLAPSIRCRLYESIGHLFGDRSA